MITPSREADETTRLTTRDVAALHELLRYRVSDPGVRAVAAELGTTEYTIRRALRRATMRPVTVARLRAALAARAHEPSAVFLTRDERSKILLWLICSTGVVTIARRLRLGTSTLLNAANGGRARRDTISRIRASIARLEALR